MKYFYSLIVIAIGFLLIWKTDWFTNFTGRIPWAEQHLGTEGGTRMLIKLIGLLMIIGTFLVLIGAFDVLLLKIFRRGAFESGPNVDTLE